MDEFCYSRCYFAATAHQRNLCTICFLSSIISIELRHARYWPSKGRIIRLEKLGQTFIVRLVIPLQYKDGHKTYYPSRRQVAQQKIVRLDE